jgi:hypothetical protein
MNQYSIMQLSTLSLLLSFTTYLSISLFLLSTNASPLNITVGFSNSISKKAGDAGVYTTIRYYSGHLQNDNTYGGACTDWSGLLDPDATKATVIHAPGTNCITTDGTCNFLVRDGSMEMVSTSCNAPRMFHPGQQPDGRWSYNIVDTKYIYLYSDTPIL